MIVLAHVGDHLAARLLAGEEALRAAFISGESNFPTSAAVALHASAHAAHEWTISGLCLAIMQAERLQKPAQSETRWSDFACSFLPWETSR